MCRTGRVSSANVAARPSTSVSTSTSPDPACNPHQQPIIIPSSNHGEHVRGEVERDDNAVRGGHEADLRRRADGRAPRAARKPANHTERPLSALLRRWVMDGRRG